MSTTKVWVKQNIAKPLYRRLPTRQARFTSFIVRGVPDLVRRRPKGTKDYLLCGMSAAMRSDRCYGRPIHISIEPTNVCNLRCPVCETGEGTLGRRKGHLTLDKFKYIIDMVHEHTNTLFFYFMGEPFLNKESYEMIRYASEKNIWVDTCTNGEFMDAQQLIESGLGRVAFQIGGMTQESHETYRVRGDLAKSLHNLEACVAEKRRNSASRTIVKVGYIVMKHNEDEVDEFIRYAKELGVDEYEIVDPCVRTVEQGHEFLTADERYWFYDKEAFEDGILRPKYLPDNYCEWLYYSTTIQVNGDIVPCCRDPKGQNILGNVFEQSFSEIWNGEKYREFRHSINTKQSDVEICELCSSYVAPEMATAS